MASGLELWRILSQAPEKPALIRCRLFDYPNVGAYNDRSTTYCGRVSRLGSVLRLQLGVERMRCPYCGDPDSRVLDSRPTAEASAIRRRRACPSCDGRFTTYERIESVPLIVVKKDGRREEFDRSKMLRGLVTASEKRPVSLATLEALVDTVEETLRNRMEPEVPSRVIGELLMSRLREIDEVAYVRFASVYRQFSDVQRFMEELQAMIHQHQTGGDPETTQK